MGVADVVFVQPHYDDVALSCGGTVAQLAAHSSPLIVTVCGGSPSAPPSEFAQMQHNRWNLADEEVIAERRKEDRRAARELGESVRTISFDLPDAIYRNPSYGSEEALFGDLEDDDYGLVAGLAHELASLGSVFAVPLAVGHHVDHQIVFRAGEALHMKGHNVWFYADLPYALEKGVLGARLSAITAASMCVRSLSQIDFDRKWNAIECYRSQLPVLFRAIEDPRDRFLRFGRSRGDRTPVERFWRLKSVANPGGSMSS